MNQKEKEQDKNVTITLPLDIINEMLYSKTFVEETDPIYDKELQGKAVIAGKNITLLRFRPKLKLKKVKIKKPTDGSTDERPKLTAKAWFHFSPSEDEDNHNHEDYPDGIAKARDDIEVDTDLDISIDQNKGKIQINPKYAVLEAKISSGDDKEYEPFCQLSIPLQLEKLKVELPLGVTTFNVPFPAPINKTFVNSGSEFPVQGTIVDNSIEFKYPIGLEEQQKQK